MSGFILINVLLVSWLCVVQGDDTFEFLMFAQQFPSAMCLVEDESGSKTCVVPQQANPWTVHGLWPSRNEDEGPEFCHNPGRKFDPSKIKPIEALLLQKWPNILPGQGETSLWKHEWEKHGSCAEAMPELFGELKYFQKSADLHDQFDVNKALQTAGITPSADKAYTNDQFIQAISAIVDSKIILTHCVRDTKNDKWYIASFRLCIDKSFAPIDCGKKDDGARKKRHVQGKLPELELCPDGDIFYPPNDQVDVPSVEDPDQENPDLEEPLVESPIVEEQQQRVSGPQKRPTANPWEWLWRMTPVGQIWNILME